MIEANDGLIGYSMDAYGVYSDHDDDGYDDFIRKISVEERDEQQIFQDWSKNLFYHHTSNIFYRITIVVFTYNKNFKHGT